MMRKRHAAVCYAPLLYFHYFRQKVVDICISSNLAKLNEVGYNEA